MKYLAVGFAIAFALALALAVSAVAYLVGLGETIWQAVGRLEFLLALAVALGLATMLIAALFTLMCGVTRRLYRWAVK